MLDRLRAKAFYSAPANYGAAFTSVWDEHGRNRIMGLTIEQIQQVMAERGLLYE
jgi:glutaconate CoA-transferase subunit A